LAVGGGELQRAKGDHTNREKSRTRTIGVFLPTMPQFQNLGTREGGSARTQPVWNEVDVRRRPELTVLNIRSWPSKRSSGGEQYRPSLPRGVRLTGRLWVLGGFGKHLVAKAFKVSKTPSNQKKPTKGN